MPDPLYLPDHCNPAFQLNWSYSIFWRKAPSTFSWLDDLKAVMEKDQVRVLQHQFSPPNVSKFLLSTKPDLAPQVMIQRTKGRLQYLIRGEMPNALRRNYFLRSIGSSKRETLEQYLEGQIEHHPMADSSVQTTLEKFQFRDDEIDLSKPRATSHGLYCCNLHLVLVNDWRWMEIRENVLQRFHDMIQRASKAKEHLLSHVAILCDHMHLLLGCSLKESPQQIALSYMNNLAYACGMKAVFKFSYYVGTFSEYDLGVIPRAKVEEEAGAS